MTCCVWGVLAARCELALPSHSSGVCVCIQTRGREVVSLRARHSQAKAESSGASAGASTDGSSSDSAAATASASAGPASTSCAVFAQAISSAFEPPPRGAPISFEEQRWADVQPVVLALNAVRDADRALRPLFGPDFTVANADCVSTPGSRIALQSAAFLAVRGLLCMLWQLQALERALKTAQPGQAAALAGGSLVAAGVHSSAQAQAVFDACRSAYASCFGACPSLHAAPSVAPGFRGMSLLCLRWQNGAGASRPTGHRCSFRSRRQRGRSPGLPPLFSSLFHLPRVDTISAL
jgi:hypothetical protein